MRLHLEGDEVIEIPDEPSMLICIMNGRFGGTGIPFAPVALLNDGMMDLVHHHGPAKFAHMIQFIQEGVSGKGQHIYADNYSYYRCKKLELINRNFVNEAGAAQPKL